MVMVHLGSWVERRGREGGEVHACDAGGGLYCVKVQVCVISTHSEYGVCVQMCEMCGVNSIRSKK